MIETAQGEPVFLRNPIQAPPRMVINIPHDGAKPGRAGALGINPNLTYRKRFLNGHLTPPEKDYSASQERRLGLLNYKPLRRQSQAQKQKTSFALHKSLFLAICYMRRQKRAVARPPSGITCLIFVTWNSCRTTESPPSSLYPKKPRPGAGRSKPRKAPDDPPHPGRPRPPA